jgi:hypothetical protein
MPKVGCGPKEAQISDDGSTMSSGNWGDPFPPPGVVNLEQGVYCLDGDFLMNGGSLTGGNVLFYIKNGQMHISGGAVLDINAPDHGEFAGLLVYQPSENKHALVLNAAPGSAVTGTILAPGATIRIKGNGSSYGFHSQLVGYTIEGDGTDNVIIKYIDEQNYDALYMPEVQFTK